MTRTSAWKWSEQTFGSAELGHKARTKRLVQIGERAAQRPAGKITQVLRQEDEQLGAYRFVENEEVDPDAIMGGIQEGTLNRCPTSSEVLIPVDGSSIAVYDPEDERGVGRIGNDAKGQRGLLVGNAIALSSEGVPYGLFDQYWWRRKHPEERPDPQDRSFWDKETSKWYRAAQRVVEGLNEHRREIRGWMQLDRGWDFKEFLGAAGTHEPHEFTVRLAQTHRRIYGEDEEAEYLNEKLDNQPVGTHRTMKVEGTEEREERMAKFQLKWCPVKFQVPVEPGREAELVEWNIVRIREVETTPEGEEPIEWWLATTKEVKSACGAHQVVAAYEKRWRIEEFHRAWKSICKVEENRLETKKRIIRWAMILGAVAMRIERLKYYSRNEPEEPATVEFDQEELDALIMLKEPDGWEPGDVPTIGEAVEWLGKLGGHANPRQGPPGATVLQRGLDELRPAARLLSKADVLGKN